MGFKEVSSAKFNEYRDDNGERVFPDHEDATRSDTATGSGSSVLVASMPSWTLKKIA